MWSINVDFKKNINNKKKNLGTRRDTQEQFQKLKG